jgi:transposase
LIYHLLRTGQVDRELTVDRPRTRRTVPQKLDPYKDLITTRLTTYPELSAVRLMAECRAAGYHGGYSQLRTYVGLVRPVEPPDPIVRFETSAGHQAQVDFAEFRFPWGKRWDARRDLRSAAPAMGTMAARVRIPAGAS